MDEIMPTEEQPEDAMHGINPGGGTGDLEQHPEEITNQEQARQMAFVEDALRSTADELNNLGLSKKAEEVLARIPDATKVARLLFELSHPKLDDFQDFVHEELTQLFLGNRTHNYYSSYVDVRADDPGREEKIQYVYDLLKVDRARREKQHACGGSWGGGRTVVGSYELYEAEGDDFTISEAADWPSGGYTPGEIELGLTHVVAPAPVVETQFVRVYIYKKSHNPTEDGETIDAGSVAV